MSLCPAPSEGKRRSFLTEEDRNLLRAAEAAARRRLAKSLNEPVPSLQGFASLAAVRRPVRK